MRLQNRDGGRYCIAIINTCKGGPRCRNSTLAIMLRKMYSPTVETQPSDMTGWPYQLRLPSWVARLLSDLMLGISHTRGCRKPQATSGVCLAVDSKTRRYWLFSYCSNLYGSPRTQPPV